MTRIIAVSLSKGGVGKTTTAVNLAAALAITGRRVLLIDTDTQGQCSLALGVEPAAGLAAFISGRATWEQAVTPARENLDLVAGGYELAGVKNEIARRSIRAEETLKSAVSPHIGSYHYVIIDTSPGWDALAINVLFLAQELLCPVLLEMAAVDGLIAFLQRVKEVQQHHNLALRYVLPTALDRRLKQTGEVMEQLREYFGETLCEPIRYNVRLSESYAHGESIFEYDPNSAGAAGYLELTKRVINDEA